MDSLPDGQHKYDELVAMSSKVMSTTSPTGCQMIEQEMQALNDEMTALQATAHDTTDSLESCVLGLEDFQHETDQFESWLEEIETQVISQTQATHLSAPEQQVLQFQVRPLHSLSQYRYIVLITHLHNVLITHLHNVLITHLHMIVITSTQCTNHTSTHDSNHTSTQCTNHTSTQYTNHTSTHDSNHTSTHESNQIYT